MQIEKADSVKWTEVVSAWSSFASALVAVLAFIAASIAAWAALKTNRNQTTQLQRLEENHESQLAASFGLWLERLPGNSDIKVFFYQNSGPQPVYEVIVQVAIREELMEFLYMEDLGPTSTPRLIPQGSEALRQAITDRTDQQVRKVSFDTGKKAREIAERDLFAETKILATLFTDANGANWMRTTAGKLEKLGSGPEKEMLVAAMLSSAKRQ